MMALEQLTTHELERFNRDGSDGFGCLQTERGVLPLKAMDLRTKIAGLIATSEVRQTYVNNLGVALEATYIFPLPDRAAVTRFVMEVAGRIVEGVIKERGQARQDYDRAIAKGQRAAITEEERPGVFTMRVGNIMPGEVATVSLTMTGPLPYDEGEATFRFPLVVAPRYIPGTALGGEDVGDGVASDTDAVPDASRISPPVLLPGYPYPVKLSLEVELQHGSIAADNVRSSLHTVVDSRDHAGRVTRVRVVPGERLNRDFILRFGYGSEAIGTSLELNPDAPGAQEGSFLLTVVPPVGLSKSTKPREVIFVLDRSGSMGGWKMVAARRAVARMVDSLSEKDSFNVYAFDDSIETPPGFGPGSLVAASNRHRFQAVEFLAKVEARGGTEMHDPLLRATQALAGGYQDRERALVLITDGQVGNEDQILRGLEPSLKNVKVYSLGIDRSVNEAFLRRLANIGGGLYELVESEDRLDEVMDRMHRRLGTPVVTETALVPVGLEVEPDTVVPRRLPDLFAGAPIFISGRYRGAPQGSLELKGRDGNNRGWSQVIRGHAVDNPGLTAVWARGQVRELEDRFVIGRGGRELEQQIVSTSIRFSVLCRFTAFLAIDKEQANSTGQLHRITQAVEAPDGWASQGAPRPSLSAMPAGRVMSMGGAGDMAKRSRSVASNSVARSSAPPPMAMDELRAAPVEKLAERRSDSLEDEAPEYASRAAPPPPMVAGRPAAPVDRKPALRQEAPTEVPAETLDSLVAWLSAQEQAEPSDWLRAFPELVLNLDRLESALSNAADPGRRALGAKALGIAAEVRGLMASRRYEEDVVRALFHRLRALLETARWYAPNTSLRQRLGSFWKS